MLVAEEKGQRDMTAPSESLSAAEHAAIAVQHPSISTAASIISADFFKDVRLFICVYDRAFSPMTDAMSVVRKKRRQKVAGSLKMKMPTITAPAAPMPVHTG